jgi:hypothetical protein
MGFGEFRLFFFGRLVNRGGDDNGSDHPSRNRCENKIAVNLTPFVTAWWCIQVIVPVINPVAAVPVVMANTSTFLPFIMANVMAVIVVVISQGNSTGKRDGQGGEGESSANSYHCHL